MRKPACLPILALAIACAAPLAAPRLARADEVAGPEKLAAVAYDPHFEPEKDPRLPSMSRVLPSPRWVDLALSTPTQVAPVFLLDRMWIDVEQGQGVLLKFGLRPKDPELTRDVVFELEGGKAWLTHFQDPRGRWVAVTAIAERRGDGLRLLRETADEIRGGGALEDPTANAFRGVLPQPGAPEDRPWEMPSFISCARADDGPAEQDDDGANDEWFRLIGELDQTEARSRGDANLKAFDAKSSPLLKATKSRGVPGSPDEPCQDPKLNQADPINQAIFQGILEATRDRDQTPKGPPLLGAPRSRGAGDPGISFEAGIQACIASAIRGAVDQVKASAEAVKELVRDFVSLFTNPRAVWEKYSKQFREMKDFILEFPQRMQQFAKSFLEMPAEAKIKLVCNIAGNLGADAVIGALTGTATAKLTASLFKWGRKIQQVDKIFTFLNRLHKAGSGSAKKLMMGMVDKALSLSDEALARLDRLGRLGAHRTALGVAACMR